MHDVSRTPHIQKDRAQCKIPINVAKSTVLVPAALDDEENNIMATLINCGISDWQNVLRANLLRKHEVDLTHVDIESDRENLKRLADQTGMIFTFDGGIRAAFFRKEKLNLEFSFL